MALFQAKVDKVCIMILGRWFSDAFLNYLRPNDPHWSQDMSGLMLQSCVNGGRHDDIQQKHERQIQQLSVIK
jgi:hypothetical protein